jgi:hypothetical protein
MIGVLGHHNNLYQTPPHTQKNKKNIRILQEKYYSNALEKCMDYSSKNV